MVEEVNQQPYFNAWREYKKLRNEVLLWTALFIVAPLSVAYVSARWVGSTTPGIVLAFIAMGGWLHAGWRLQTWTCPRCGEVFGTPLRRSCRHCGLAKEA